MTSDRARAYGRVTKTLEELSATKLQPAEVERIRAAADELFFSETASQHVLGEVRDLIHHLVDSGRWLEERAHQLLDDIEGCGPLARR